MILNYGFYFLLFLLVNSYKFAPINKYVYTIDINDYGINVIERSKINKKESKCLLFLTGGSGALPPQIYSHFMDNLASVGLPVYTPHSNYKNKDLLVKQLSNEFKEVIIVGHSSGGTTAINYAKNPKIKKLILIDPVDTRIFSKEYRNKLHELENLDSVLFLRAEKSYKISFTPLGFPFIPILGVNKEILRLKNSCKVYEIEAINFGHSDILDLHYSNLMHKSRITVGTSNRTFDRINDYHNWVTDIFYHYSKGNLKKSKIPKNRINWK